MEYLEISSNFIRGFITVTAFLFYVIGVSTIFLITSNNYIIND